MTIKEARNLGSAALINKDAAFFLSNDEKLNFITSPSPVLDADILLCYVLQKNKTHLLLNPTELITKENLDKYFLFLKKRMTGLPIAYITNTKEFYGFDFYVTQDVLIPKPDTEILVENAVNLIIQKIKANPQKILTICDMCTGSGCIAISVLKTLITLVPKESIPLFILVDLSPKALEIAKINAQKLIPTEYLSKIRFVQSNLFQSVLYTFDVILTNPPYIPHTLVNELLQDGRSEPVLALDGDITEKGERANCNDGLEIIRRLIPQSIKKLSNNGLLLMETGEYNAKEASIIAKQNGFKEIEILKDLENQLRVVKAVRHI